ncbi:hypothetical protein DICPUDRAFT_57884 [Dictyostelium purpureum]|uniref:Flavin-containing monooxygenase n=1 Tax=Dictyostelium purpureum TaxID=5786 RepID=F0ZY38_DICPU|nr:uncharacterized protein DICPUDRAFT_57884 [Dictyostelium purpureum]EGC31147.1 hypothetical protein DICPUDRAFT_57884 [Dictyostelium purpureum]|eukprot:XP_003292335.1 hypothetical protein DICPUDRAFT_57884 [Dictyostelium purpureum]
MKNIAIIGGGAGGLVSCKSVLEIEGNNYIPTVFEKEPNLGGIWVTKNTKVWNSLKTTISKLSCVFSDFPFEDDEETKDEFFLTQPQLYKYLYQYALHFDLIKYIQFNSNVVKVLKEGNDKWKIQWTDTTDQSATPVLKERVFDQVIICSGINNKPAKFDKDELLEAFTGKLIHSKDYKSPESYKNKRVLVVGNSESSTHICTDLTNHAHSVHQLIRGQKDKWVINRDVTLTLNNGAQVKMPIDFVFYIRNQNYENLSLTNTEYNKFLNKSFQKLSKNNHECEQLQFKKSFEMPPYSIITCDEYISNIKSGKIQILKGYSLSDCKGKVITLESNSPDENGNRYFKNEYLKSLEFDDIILCNGYNLDLSFLDTEILQDIEFIPDDYNQPCILYRGVFPKNLKNIAFVGLINTPYYTTLELMARFACLVFSGKKQLAAKDEFDINLKEQYEIRYNSIKNQHFSFVDHVIHSDQLAKEIGCLPDFDEIKKTNTELYEMLWNGLFCNACYRLVGENSKPSLSKKTLNYYYMIYKKITVNEKY